MVTLFSKIGCHSDLGHQTLRIKPQPGYIYENGSEYTYRRKKEEMVSLVYIIPVIS